MFRKRAPSPPVAPSTPDPSRPSVRRRRVLSQASCKNVSAGRPPYAGIHISSLGEVLWILVEHCWAGGILDGGVVPQESVAWFSEAFEEAIRRAHGVVGPADFRQADLRGTNLDSSDLRRADLRGVHVEGASLVEGALTGALLTGVHLDINTRLLAGGRVDALPAAVAANRTAGMPPATAIRPESTTELLWLMQTCTIQATAGEEHRIDLRGADLSAVALGGIDLAQVALQDAQLITAGHAGDLRSERDKNVRDNLPPFAEVTLRSRNELLWLAGEEQWSADKRPNLRRARLTGADLALIDLALADFSQAALDGADLRCAHLQQAHFINATLTGGTWLDEADLEAAHFQRADLTDARLVTCDLFTAHFRGASLVNAVLTNARVSVADLRGADCRGANFAGADLRGAKVDAGTSFIEITLDTSTRLGDLVLVGTPLTQIDFRRAPKLGDETLLIQALRLGRLQGKEAGKEFRDAIRAYRSLASVLQAQGLYGAARQYYLRERRLHRRNLRRQGKWPRWAFSLVLDAFSGYGQQPGKTLLAFFATIVLFALIYVPLSHSASLSPTSVRDLGFPQALLVSVGSLENFTPQSLNVLSVLRTIEAAIGWFIFLLFSTLTSYRLRHL